MAEGVSNTDRDIWNLRPLHIACDRGSLSDAKAAIQHYGYTACGLKDEYGCLPLHYACQHSHDETLDLVKLVSYDCDLNTVACIDRLHRYCKYHSRQNKLSGQTPLHMACKSGNSDLLRFLIDKGSRYLVNRFGQEPLHIACQHGHISIAKLLIKRYGLKICSHQDSARCLPLHYACCRNSLELVKLMSEVHDVNVAACVKPVYSYSYLGYHSICSYSAARNEAIGQTPLHIACKADHLDIDIITFLLGKVKHVDEVENCFNQTLLHIACMRGNVIIAKLLIKKYGYGMCAIRDSDQCLPLHYACQHDSLELVSLVNKGNQFTVVSCINSWYNWSHNNCLLRGKQNKACGETPLHIACNASHLHIKKKAGCSDINIDIIEFLLGKVKHADEVKNCFNETLLHIACMRGNVIIAKLLIKKYGYGMCAIRDSDQCLPLHYACQHDSLELVSLVNIEQCTTASCVKSWYSWDHDECWRRGMWNDFCGQTPLHIASKTGCVHILHFLVDKCSHEHILNCHQQNLLHVACKEDDLEVINILIKKYGYGMCSVQDIHGYLPMDYIQDSCDDVAMDMMKMMSLSNVRDLETLALTNGNFYLTEVSGQTPLHTACKSGNSDLLRFLIDKGSRYLVNRFGQEPLHIACQHGHISIAKLLIKRYGLKICSHQDSARCLPLHYACCQNSLELVKLVSEVHDVNVVACVKPMYSYSYSMYHSICSYRAARNEAIGQTPLHIACKADHLDIDIITFLLGKVKHTDKVKNCFNATLLHIACMRGNVIIARLLIKKYGYGMCTVRDSDQCLPLHYACQHDSLELVKLVNREQLTTASCVKSWYSWDHDECWLRGQVNKACGQTPLHIASITGCVQIISFLLDKRVILNCHEQNLLHVACAQGNIRVAEMIIEKYGYRMCSDQDRYGCLPLHYACQHDSLELVELASNACNVNMLSKDYICYGSIQGETALHVACRACNPTIVRYLCKMKGCDPTICNHQGNIAYKLWPNRGDQLHRACQSGVPDLVRYVFQKRAHNCTPILRDLFKSFAHWPNEDEQLHEACKSGIHELVAYLIQVRKCDPNVENSSGLIPFELWPEKNSQLRIACRCGATQSVIYLVERKEHSIGALVLHEACRRGVPELVKYLVEERKCDCSIRNKSGKLAFGEWPDGKESLHDACRSGVIQLVKYLLRIKKCDTSIKDSKGQLPLHIACQENSLRIVQLVSSNCDVNTADSVNEYTPLHIACKEGYVDIALFLVSEKCCSLSVEDVHRRTPFDLWPSSKDQLQIACTSGFSELVHYLVKQRKCVPSNYQGESVFRLWPKGKEQLHIACKSGIPELVQYVIINRKCDITLRNNDKTLNHNKKLAFELWPISDDQLHKACKSGIPELVKYLIEERKCDLNSKNLAGEIPLHIACRLGYPPLAQMLCTSQNVNITSSNGSTPLHIACDNERKDIVIFLIQQMHAKYNIQDENGELPLHIACRKLTLTEVKLLSDDCDVNTVSCKRERPFDIAVRRNNVPSIISFLVDVRKCDIVINRDEQNPLLINVRSRLKDMETKPLKLAKLMITGAPRVGKSSFKNRLVGKLMLSLSPSTSAIDAPTLVMIKHMTHISATPASDGLPWEEMGIDQQIENLIESGQSGDADVLLRESVSIHIIDTGGQPEFHKILPILITGPAINLILFKLNEELWERCVIEFVRKDGSFEEPYVTSYTHEDVIFQIISSVSCFTQPSTFPNLDKEKQEDIEHIESHCNNPVCVLVGTHKDVSEVTEEVIERANDYLTKKLEKTNTNCDGLIDSTIAAISNKDPDDTRAGIADFRDFLTSLVHEKCQIVDIPPRWFSFQFHLVKSGSKVMKLKICKAIARKCGIENDQEFNAVLTYLHYHVGTLLWYRQVTMYKDLVIVDIQSLYNRITELMANTFTKTNVHDNEYKLFKNKGQFTSSVLARESKKKPGYFSFDHLIHLLQYLHIATCIKKSKNKKMRETVYFMPCVLRSAEVESLFYSIKLLPHPLLVQFECGFCPVGVFCFIIVELLECSSLKWELCDEETQYSNMMVLRAGKDYDKITFIEKNTYYEIRIEPDSQFTEPSLPYHARCHQVKQCVHESLQNVIRRLNYSRLSEHKFAFFCPRRECQQKYCVAVEGSMDTKELKCLRCKKPSPVPSQCLYWYGEKGKIKPDDIQSPTTITTSEIDIYPLGKFISSLNFICIVVIPA